MAAVVLIVLLPPVDFPAACSTLAGLALQANATHPVKVALYAGLAFFLWCFVSLPTTLPECLIGFIFGLREGYFIDLLSKTGASIASYSLGRSLLLAYAERLLDRHPVLVGFEAEANGSSSSSESDENSPISATARCTGVADHH